MAPAKLTCLLFDLDGTLIDSMGLIFASYRHALREVLGLAVSEEALVACFGKPLVQGLACLAGLPSDLPATMALTAHQHQPANADEAQTEQALMRRLLYTYRKHNLEHHDEYVHSFPRVNETLAELQQRGYALAVVTSKAHLTADLSARHCGLDRYLGTLVALEDTATHKPDPAPLLLALRRLGRRPEEALYLGDAAVDVLAARAAGVTAAAALWSPLPRDVLLALAPDHALESIDQLLVICPPLR